MLSKEIKSKIDNLWDKFWSRGMANPLTAIEQISYLLFMRRLDQTDQNEVERSADSGNNYSSIFEGDWDSGQKGEDGKPILIDKEELRWTSFKNLESSERLDFINHYVFPFLKELNKEASPYARHMKTANFYMPNARLLDDAMEAIDEIFDSIQEDQESGQKFQDTQGDVYEYLLNELKNAGKNGQFRTPRHLIRFLVEILDPDIGDKICDPAAGTGGFLVAAYQHILSKHSSAEKKVEDDDGFFNGLGDQIKDEKVWKQLKQETFYGYDIDSGMVRIGLMNMMLHGITYPHIENLDTLSKKYDENHQEAEFSMVLANPPFTGKISKNDKSDEFKISSNSTELLFLERIMKMLKPGGKGGVIIPEGVLFGSSKANKQLREILLKDCQLDAVISLPSGVFKPYTGVKTAMLVFTKAEQAANQFHTEKVWFYELESDGYSLDDNRRRLKESPLPGAVLDWEEREEKSSDVERKGKHFFVTLKEIQDNGYDLSFNRYKEFDYEEQDYDPPKKILESLMALEDEIVREMKELNDLIG